MTPELQRLRRALDAMPAPERAVFERVRFGNRDFTGIARELDIGIEEVERRLAAAMVHLVSYGEDEQQR